VVEEEEEGELGGLEMPDVHVLLDAKERMIQRLQEDLHLAQSELKTKDEKCGRLEEMQGKVDSEIHELTASLFQEAYRMVQEANEKRVTSQKLLNEANGKIDVLQAEVEALKVLVITSTPSAPNKHLFPHLLSRNAEQPSRQAKSTEKDRKRQTSSSGHKRNYSDSTSSMSGSTTTNSDEEPIVEQHSLSRAQQSEYREIDPVYHKEFVSWREKLDTVDKKQPFLRRVYNEDILPCLDFANSELARIVLEAIESNRIIIEQIAHDEPTHATNCALSDVPRVCNYRLKLENYVGDDGTSNNAQEQQWLFISTLCRNRIAAVCNFLTYLRYLNQGLVKCGVNDAYWEISRLRRCMALARLGYDFEAF